MRWHPADAALEERNLEPVGFGEKYLMVRMIESFRASRAVDHYRLHAHALQAREFFGGALGVLQRHHADRFEAIRRLVTRFGKPDVIRAADSHRQDAVR